MIHLPKSIKPHQNYTKLCTSAKISVKFKNSCLNPASLLHKIIEIPALAQCIIMTISLSKDYKDKTLIRQPAIRISKINLNARTVF